MPVVCLNDMFLKTRQLNYYVYIGFHALNTNLQIQTRYHEYYNDDVFLLVIYDLLDEML